MKVAENDVHHGFYMTDAKPSASTRELLKSFCLTVIFSDPFTLLLRTMQRMSATSFP
jgi:hypothetical protein